jgi:hypothetical protein
MERNRDHQYALLKEHGYRIDTRGSRFTLIKGVSAQAYDTFDEALNAALIAIDPKLVRYTHGA